MSGKPRRKAMIPFRLKLSLVGGLLALVPLGVVGVRLLDINADELRVNAWDFQLAGSSSTTPSSTTKPALSWT